MYVNLFPSGWWFFATPLKHHRQLGWLMMIRNPTDWKTFKKNIQSTKQLWWLLVIPKKLSRITRSSVDHSYFTWGASANLWTDSSTVDGFHHSVHVRQVSKTFENEDEAIRIQVIQASTIAIWRTIAFFGAFLMARASQYMATPRHNDFSINHPVGSSRSWTAAIFLHEKCTSYCWGVNSQRYTARNIWVK